jgi:hypothetical protein
VQPPAAALDLVLVVLGDGDTDLWDLVLLVAVHDTEVPGAGQIITAVAAALGEPVAAIIGVIGPRQMRPRRPGLFAPRPFRPIPAALTLLRRRGLARLIIARGRVRGVLRVARQQMLQPGQPGGEGLVGLHQPRDLHGLRGDLPRLTPHHDDQLITRHLLRLDHPKIKPHTRRSPRDRHDYIANRRRPPRSPAGHKRG